MVQGLPRGAGLRRSQGPGRPNRPRRAPLPRVPAPSPRRPRGSGRTSGLAATPRRATPARRPRAPLRRRGLGALRPGMGAAQRRPNRSRSARPGPAPAPLTARSAPRPPPRPPPAAPHLATGADRTQAGEEAEWLPRRRLPGSRQPDSSGRAEAACGTRPPTAHARPRPRPAAGHRRAPQPSTPRTFSGARPAPSRGSPGRPTPLPPTQASPMWLSSMCSMRSASVGKWSPQPPKRQVLEKKEAAAMPVMVLHREPPGVGSASAERGGGGRGRGGGRRGEGSASPGRRRGGARWSAAPSLREAAGGGGSSGRGRGGLRAWEEGPGARLQLCGPQPRRPRPHLAAPASNFTSLGLPFAVRGACGPPGASLAMCITFLIDLHLLITHGSLG